MGTAVGTARGSGTSAGALSRALHPPRFLPGSRSGRDAQGGTGSSWGCCHPSPTTCHSSPAPAKPRPPEQELLQGDAEQELHWDDFGWPVWCHTAQMEADLELLCSHNTGITPSCPILSHPIPSGADGGRTEAPWSCHARCQTVLALLGFGQGKGMFPCWHWGWGLCWVIPREGSVALGVQRAQLGAQDKNGVKMR